MKKYLHNIYFFIIYFLFPKEINSFITFPLLKDTSSISKIETPAETIKKLFNSNLYIMMNIGSQKTDVKVYLSMERFELMIGGKEIKTHKYNENISESYYCSYCNEKEFSYGKYSKGIISKETFYINFNNKEIKPINNMNFILGTKSVYLNPPEAFVGLIFPYFDSDVNYNLFYSLKIANATNSYNWYLNFTENDSKMVIDILPHEYNKEYNEEKFKTVKTIYDGYYFIWALEFNSIYYNNENNNITLVDNTRAKIDFGIKYILAPNETGKYFENVFFDDYYKKNICFKEEININIKYYYFIYCKNTEELDIKTFKSIYFKNIPLNSIFELNHKDLFIRENNYIYFLIIFQKESFWTFGEPFLRKYILVFNHDQKTIGFYHNYEEDKKENKKDDNNPKSNEDEDKYKILYLIILILILVGVVATFVMIYLKKGKRKNKANELDDNFEYISKSNEEDNKIIDEDSNNNDKTISPD